MMSLLFIGVPELIPILIIILLLFGGRKIPELMKGLGQGVRNFKDGMNGTADTTDNKGNEEKKDSSSDEATK